MFDPTELLDEARVEGTALEGTQIIALLAVVERLAAWRAVLQAGSGAAPRQLAGDRGVVAPLRERTTFGGAAARRCGARSSLTGR